ncbi:Aste57867_3942 [Aphanomyces stellatus]|uniref:Aste57867_3942 protein n=1 Tax=Aphanomyces stellatus TaxID=120398 RepID=A0A485KG93_9STRA|nr:hypothetical protein As57867_003931 [Aphanomyces stellatus]VFT81079.1 Aste57867_3942 [Aphanomyces stellatus]
MLRRKRRRLLPPPPAADGAKSAETHEALDTIDDDVLDDGVVMNDTLAAIHLLLGRHHSGFAAIGLPSLVLWHQIYSIVPNRTVVDQSVYRMRNDGLLMTMRIALPGPPATAILLTSDYIAFMLQYTVQHSATRVFAKALPQLSKSLTISKNDIYDAIQLLFVSRKRPIPSTAVLEKSLTHLVQSGFLIATTDLTAQLYSFSLPRLGLFITSVARARVAIQSILKRTQYKQMPQVDLKKRKLTCSSLSMDFHLLDMEGVHLVKRLPSSQTFVVCLLNDDDGNDS